MKAWTLEQLAASVARASGGRLSAALGSHGATAVRGVAPLDAAAPDELSFLANSRYRAQARASSAGAIVLTPGDAQAVFGDSRPAPALVVSDAPYAWFAFAAQALAPATPWSAAVAADAFVSELASLDADVRIDPGAVIEAGARIEARAWIGSGCFVGAAARVGADTRLYPGARLLDRCAIGARGIVHSGAVIGADGFGFAPLDGRWIKIPQTGRVQIGDDVEIGANSTIDRGAMGDTLIEDGVKIDNQVQIGHNCRIGAHTAIAGCVGIAGSTTIGRGCQIGGAAMIGGHLKIPDGTIVSGASAVARSITEPGFFTGFFPLMTNREWERSAAVLRHLGELRDRVRHLEAALRRSDAGGDGKGEPR